MAQESKKLGEGHRVLAENVRALMRHKAAQGCSKLSTPVGIQDHADKPVGKSTIYRILNQGISPRLEQLERIAEALGVPAWRLLYPGLDPAQQYEVIPKQEQAERDRAIEELAERRAEEIVNIMVGQAMSRHHERQQPAPSSNPPDSEVPAGRPQSGTHRR